MDAREITAALSRGKWHGSYGTACCPAHEDRSPSLAVRDADDGRTLVRCHAGCEQEAVIRALIGLGLWSGAPSTISDRVPVPRAKAREEDPARSELALAIYAEATPDIWNTPVGRYLSEARAIPRGLPAADLRYHARCPRDRERVPALVALFRNVITDRPQAIHRIFLKPDGNGHDGKMMLGPVAGAAIKLSPDHNVTLGLGIAEGIETGLSVLGFSWAPIWCAGSASNIESLPVLTGLQSLTIFADADPSGRKAAALCAKRYHAAGVEARILEPAGEKTDWNDVGRRRHG